MDKRIKRIINDIANLEMDESIILGDLVAKEMFRSDRAALVINHEKQIMSLVTISEVEKNDLFHLIMSVLSEINKLSDLSLILLSKPVQDGISVFYSNKTDLVNTQDPEIIDLGNSITLSLGNDSCELRDNKVLNGKYYVRELYELIVPVFCSRIYPGAGLAEYITNGFQSKELKLATRAYIISIIAIIVAIVLCVASPVISSIIGWSTINPDQFQELLDSISTIR